jgi:hypothetical protein
VGVGAKRFGGPLDGFVARTRTLRADQIAVAALCSRAGGSGDWYRPSANRWVEMRSVFIDIRSNRTCHSTKIIASRITPSISFIEFTIDQFLSSRINTF